MIETLKTSLPQWVFQAYGKQGAVACYPAGGLNAEAFGELSRIAPVSSVCGCFYVVTHLRYEWSNRNKLPNGRWGTFLYCPGAEMATGTRVYYGRNEWATEAEAATAQTEWEKRWNKSEVALSRVVALALKRLEHGGALTEFLFWLWLACMFAGSGWIMFRILFALPIG